MIPKQQLRQSYEIVKQDLFTLLLKLPQNQSISLSKLGKFTKTLRTQKSPWTQKTYSYYHLKFTPF